MDGKQKLNWKIILKKILNNKSLIDGSDNPHQENSCEQIVSEEGGGTRGFP
jgi:hypothetical protein